MRRRGSQAVEFALLVPVLVGMAAGTIDTGSYLMQAGALVHAVADGARAGAADDDDRRATGIAVATDAYEATGLPGTPEFTASVAGSAPDQKLTVQGSLPFDPPFGWFSMPASIDYQGSFLLLEQ